MKPPPPARATVHVDDDGYTLVLQPTGTHSADFWLYSIAMWDTADREHRYWPKKDWRALPQDTTDDLGLASPLASGFVKWDGCLELEVGCSEDGRHHMCGRSSGEKFARALMRIWDEAAKVLPGWNAEAAK